MKKIIKDTSIVSFMILMIEIFLCAFAYYENSYNKESILYDYIQNIIFFFNILIIPIGLPIYNFILNIKRKSRNFIFTFLLIELTVFLGYMLYGFTLERIEVFNNVKPMEMTVGWLFVAFLPVSAVIVLIESVIFQIILGLKKYN